MDDKKLISQIRELRQIKPSQDWVVLTKNQILGHREAESPSILSIFRVLFSFKPAFAAITATIILFGLFGFSQGSLPGDLLYPIKKLAEKSQSIFVSEEKKSQIDFEIANKRLNELTKIAETNQVKKLAPALEEYQASLMQASKDLAKLIATTSDAGAVKKIAEQTQKLEQNKEILSKTYGIAGLEGSEEINPTKLVVEWLINDLKKRTLTEEQATFLTEADNYYQAGDYNQALERILEINQ